MVSDDAVREDVAVVRHSARLHSGDLGHPLHCWGAGPQFRGIRGHNLSDRGDGGGE